MKYRLKVYELSYDTKIAPTILTQRPPAAVSCPLGGLVILPRMLEKRATLAKKNGVYNYQSGTDSTCQVSWFSDPKALLKQLAKGKGDGDILRMVPVAFQDPARAVGNRNPGRYIGKTRTRQRRPNALSLCLIRRQQSKTREASRTWFARVNSYDYASFRRQV